MLARPAATAMLVTDGPDGIEVLMVRRRPRGFFGGLMVFPGGAVDPEDESPLAKRVVSGDHPDITLRTAVLREVAEETGIALTTAGARTSPPGRGAALFRAMDEARMVLDATGLTLVSRWVTPEYAPKRFDTRFYLVRTVDPPPVRVDLDELEDHCWVSPREALHRHDAGEWDMFLPTVAHLRWLGLRGDVAEALASASGADGRSLIQPREMEDGSIVPVHMPGEQ